MLIKLFNDHTVTLRQASQCMYLSIQWFLSVSAFINKSGYDDVLYTVGILIPHSSVTELHNVLTKVAEQATGHTNE